MIRIAYVRKAGPQLILMNSAKRLVEDLLNRLPDECSLEEIQYRVYVLAKTLNGLEDARLNGTLSQEEIENRVKKWWLS